MGEQEHTSIVDRAVAALQEFGDIDHATAERLLSSWTHRVELSELERAEVLRRFMTVDRVQKCADCGELVEHYAGEPADVWHHLGWSKAVHQIRTKVNRGGNVEVWCTCQKWRGQAPSDRAAQRGWDQHVESMREDSNDGN